MYMTLLWTALKHRLVAVDYNFIVTNRRGTDIGGVSTTCVLNWLGAD